MKSLKKIAIALFCFSAITYVSSQTVIYHEDFEMPTAGDSVISSGNPGWAINTNLYYNGLQSDSSYVALGDTTMLTTSSFSTVGYYFVLLEFSHICKIEFIDNATIEVSNDNGATWTKATASQYLGSGQFGSQGDKFSSVSYITNWQAVNNYAIPTNSWWKTEQFNISPLVSNASQVKVRFVLSDGNLNGTGFNYGWLIDDISITVAYSELIPPTISLNTPILGDTVYNTGPFTVSSDIIDASGVDTAFLVYTVNGQNPDTLGMFNPTGNTYIANIPSYTYGNIIGYYIVAIDVSPASNVGRYPAVGIDTFLVLQGPLVVEIGTGLLYTYYIPTYGNYDYGWSSIIYKNSEINKGGLIDSISFYVENAVTGYQMNNQKVYMANVPYSTYANANRPDTSAMVLVFSGTIAWNGPGWQKIPLQIPFGYNGNDNLLIYYENRDGSGATGYPRFRYTTTSPEQLTKYRIQNISFPTTPGSFYYNRPNIRIAFSPSNFTHDAGISQIIQPQAGIVLSNTLLPVEVVVKNYGVDTLTKATLGWSIDGTVKNTTNWTGNLLQDVVSTPVVIGIDSFIVGSHQIKTWTSMPNDSADKNNYNDTTYVNFYACSSILNGVYTIGGSTADFPTINDALENLNICGLSGSVVFNINSGTYVTQFEISEVPGTSDTNTITFQSATGNHNDVIITYDSVDYSNNYILKLNGAKHFRFKNITFKATNNTYGKVIELAGSTKDNRFIGNKFETLIGTSTSTYFVLVNSLSGTSNIDSLSVFDSNTFIGGSYGMYLYGNNGAPEDSIIITNNHFIDQYSRAIQAYYQKSSQIIGNTITSNNYSLYYGMYFYNCSNNMRILKNKITLTNSPNQAYGMYLTSSNGIQGNEILIANNFLVLASSYRAIGLFISSCNYINTYHNSIDMIIADQNWEVRTVNLQGTCTNLDFKNNIFANSGGGLTMVVFMTTGVTSDYNVLYTTGANIGAWGSPTCLVQPNITSWRNTTSQDYNSLAVNPKFYSNTNLHTQNPAINNLGTGLFMVTDDIDGDPRSTTNPDMGADEFTIYPDDAGIVSITAPSIASCGLSANENVTVKIKNFGSDTITTCNVAYVLNNGTPVNETVSAAINPNTIHTYTFSTKANLSAAGNHTITCYTNLTGDSYHVNDSVINYTVINSHDFTSGSFTLGFEVNENIDGWNSHDNNGDGHTWEFPYNNPINSKTGLNCARFVSDSAHNGNDWLVSRCFYLQTGTAYKVGFSYKIASALYPHSLEVKLGSTLNPVFLNTMLRKKDTITNDNYNDIFTVFTVPSNGIYYIGWHAISPATGIGTNFDLFIDDIIIELAPAADAEILSFVSPNGGCGLGNETVEIQLRNLGSSAISGNITANYQIVGTSSIVTENITASITPGDTLNYTFTTTAGLSVLTSDSIFDLICWVNLSGDIDQNNDTLRKAILSKYQPADPIANNITSLYAQTATIIALSPDTLF